jgi:hypothetical protein
MLPPRPRRRRATSWIRQKWEVEQPRCEEIEQGFTIERDVLLTLVTCNETMANIIQTYIERVVLEQ